MGDNIKTLPVDKTDVPQADIEIINTFFKEHKNILSTIYVELKDTILAMGLFVLLSLPQVTFLINKFVSRTEDSLMWTLAVKALIFGVIFYIFKNFSSEKKN